MKKLLALMILIMAVSACSIVVGDFEPKREKLHKMGNDICEKDPSRCINGIPW